MSDAFGVVEVGFWNVWDDVFQCEFFMGEASSGNHNSALLWGQRYLEVDFRGHTAEVARGKEFTGGRGVSINFFSWRRYLLITFLL